MTHFIPNPADPDDVVQDDLETEEARVLLDAAENVKIFRRRVDDPTGGIIGRPVAGSQKKEK